MMFIRMLLMTWIWSWKKNTVTYMAPVKKLWKPPLACVRCWYFLIEPVTMIFSLGNLGSNPQGIYIFLNKEGDDLL